MADPSLAELGEGELIRRLGRFAPPGQFEDDAALLPGNAPGDLVLNTDVLVEGIHFSEATTTAFDVGWRAAAANLSDLAAMGCTSALGLTVGLVAPGATPWSWVEGAYEGLAAALQAHGGQLLGGDCSDGAQRLLAITAIGQLDRGAGAIRRGDGLPGDRLVCTGVHGLSRLGLALLRQEPGLDPHALAADLMQQAIQAHRHPRPRFDAVRALQACRPADLPWRVGGCDSSDGLAAAVAAIAAASGCGARLNPAALPVKPAMAPLPQAQAWCLGGGEDFELVLALAPAWAEALVTALPGSRAIGELVSGGGGGGDLCWSGGEEIATGGYSHFSPSGR
jgi:thiamine-monophosphate kinase